MKRALWTPLAAQELEEILLYIRIEDSRPETAIRIGQEIDNLTNRQAAHPTSGHKHHLAPDGWLYIQHKRWLIFYQPHEQGIEVMRIVDTVRDLPAVLKKDSQ